MTYLPLAAILLSNSVATTTLLVLKGSLSRQPHAGMGHSSLMPMHMCEYPRNVCREMSRLVSAIPTDFMLYMCNECIFGCVGVYVFVDGLCM